MRHSLIYAVFCSGLVCQPLVAEVQLGVFSNISVSDNGNLAGEGGDKQTETILESGVDFNADIEGNIYAATADYNASNITFIENTQQDRNFLIGTSNFRLGSETGRLNLNLTHSRQLASIQRFGATNLDNTEQRDILSAVPTLRLQPNRRDTFTLSGSYTETAYNTPDTFEEDSVNLRPDSSQIGQNFLWNRALSPISTFSLLASRNVSEVDGVDVDFEYEQLMLTYASNLRVLNYSIGVGYNRATFLSEQFSSPSGELSAEYENGAHALEFGFISQITETSQGNRNRVGVGGGGGNINSPVGRDNAADGGIDTYKYYSAELSYAYEFIPNRFNAQFIIRADQSRFQINEDSDVDSLFTGVNLNYIVNRRSDLAYEFGWWQIEPVNTERESTRNNAHRLTYAINFNQAFDVSFFVAREDWDTPTDVGSFTQNSIGANLAYQIF